MADNRLPLDMSGKTTRAMRPIVHGGRRYAAGDPFPWRQLSISVRKARQLHDLRFITSGDYEEETPPKPAKKVAKKKAATKRAAGPGPGTAEPT